MDLVDVERVLTPRTRAELVLDADSVPLGGGTWLYSEPQEGVGTLVDLTGMGWTPWTRRADGALSIAATCTIAELVRIPAAPPLFVRCAESLLASFKVWNVATVGGNIGASLAAGAMTSLATALDAELVLWGAEGRDRRIRVEDFVLAQRVNARRNDEVIRSIELPAAPLAARHGFRRIALSSLGRAGTVVCARRDADLGFVVGITGGTLRPAVLRFADLPTAHELGAAIDGIDSWFTDAHGDADWREAMSRRFAEQLRIELA